MAPAFSKEAILQGSIDHLCLVCESYLKSEREVCLHVSTQEHGQKLDKTHYVQKYRNDRIRKVKKGYFCEFCNVLVTTMTAAGIHVNDSRHVANKSSQLDRVDDAVVTENAVIFDKAWHGLIDDNTCTICDVEFEDYDVHKSEPTHVINLIQSKVSDDNSYCMIDDSIFHCLTCNEVVAEITAHLADKKHKEILQQSNKTIFTKNEKNEKNIEVTQTLNKDLKLNTKIVNDNESYDILDSIPKFQKNNINVNFESCIAFCRTCSMNLEFSCKEIEKHIEEHKYNVENKTTETKPKIFGRDEYNKPRENTLAASPVQRSEKVEAKIDEIKQDDKIDNIQKVAEENGLTYISAGNKVYCQRCDRKVPSSVKNILCHTNGEGHKSRKPINSTGNQIAKREKKCNLVRVPLIKFAKGLRRGQTALTEDVILNNKYCIDMLSFYYYTIISPGRVRCQICEINIGLKDINEHQDTARHSKAMKEVPVLIRTDSEFIREIRSGIFQCGYCNIYDSWEGMEHHLRSSDHKESLTFANWRLSRYASLLRTQRLEHHIQETFLRLLVSSINTD